jgi:hypothetical protein
VTNPPGSFSHRVRFSRIVPSNSRSWSTMPTELPVRNRESVPRGMVETDRSRPRAMQTLIVSDGRPAGTTARRCCQPPGSTRVEIVDHRGSWAIAERQALD